MSKKQVLVVEDEAMIAMLFEDALAEAGYDVAVASDGASAIALIESMPTAFEALITDIRMPGGLTGCDIARRLREFCPYAAVIFLTGDSMLDHKDHGVPDSVMHHKPVPVEQVLASLVQLL